MRLDEEALRIKRTGFCLYSGATERESLNSFAACQDERQQGGVWRHNQIQVFSAH